MIQLTHPFHHALKVSDFLNILMHFSQISLANNLFAKRLKRVGKKIYKCICVLVAQSCPSLCNSMNCNLPSAHCPWRFSRQEYWSGLSCCYALLQGIFPTQGLNPCLLYCRQILYHLSHQGSPNVYTYICMYVYIYIHTYKYIYICVCV